MTYQLKEEDELLGPYKGVWVEEIRYWLETTTNWFYILFESPSSEPKYLMQYDKNGALVKYGGEFIYEYETGKILAYCFNNCYFGSEQFLLQYISENVDLMIRR